MQRYPYTEIAMVLALLIYVWTALRVGAARGKYHVPAPAMDGPPEFLRTFRVQMNTLEQLALFLPALWLFATGWSDIYAAVLGVIWCVGRVLFALGYYAAPEKRDVGFGITFLTSIVLLLGGLAGTVRNML
jgi:glutathione S-transferase